ncbi:hypothetical protein AAFC00_000668 [Neodothiora populina]|uniref:HTH La-type RNA-binding domain-containing protein n=1 Tax=Neodothiora populina TaxID=2781224 RepID=A0ABR3PDW4_9PEZI
MEESMKPVQSKNTCSQDVEQVPPPVEHAEGEAIRRQVEFYFSDGNLPTDAHMLMKTGGLQNLPVSIKHICGFARMRKYKPYRSVVESLKKSTLLDVVENKFLKRKTPLAISPKVAPQTSENNAKNSTQKAVSHIAQAAQGKPWMTKGMLKPTGFEEYYADPPVTPAVFATERELYERRIETAIYRYTSKRKFHQEPAFIFNKFLKYGGIECSPNQFSGGGLGDKELEERNAHDIAAANARHKISEDVTNNEDLWVVDFEGVAKGFLSSLMVLTRLLYASQHEIELTTNILRNFYNYLLHHDVCPEYTDQINAAREICKLADKELLDTILVGRFLPDSFSSAASRIYGGVYANVLSDGQDWDGADNFGGSELDSRDIIVAAVSAYGSEEQYDSVTGSADPEIALQADVIFEVTGTEVADAETFALYEAARETKPFLKTTGKMHCRHWTYPLARRSAVLGRLQGSRLIVETFTLWIENEVLLHVFPGMKIEGVLKGLDNGIVWLDMIYAVSPTFFELLPNEYRAAQKAGQREVAGASDDAL